MTDHEPLPGWAADAARDALALLRAHRDKDGEAVIVVSRHLSDPRLTASILAGLLALATMDLGWDEEELRELTALMGIGQG